MGPKILNFQSFALYKGKIIPRCSLELGYSKNVYFSHDIFNIFRRNGPHFPIFLKSIKHSFCISTINQGVDVLPLSSAQSMEIIDIYHNWLHAFEKKHAIFNNRFQQCL